MSEQEIQGAVSHLVQTLACSPEPLVTKSLSLAAAGLDQEDIREGVLEGLKSVEDPSCIDAICTVWAETRHPALADLLIEKKWVASSPAGLRVFSALKTGQIQILSDEGPEIIEFLFQAAQDSDADLSGAAQRLLRELDNPNTREEICLLVIQEDHPLAQQAAVDAGYAPHNPQQRALFYLLTEQWDAYEALDFDASLLKTIYESGDEHIRRRIASFARQAGRLEFVDVVAGGRQQRRLEEMTGSEWEVILALLVRYQDWDKMWQLAQLAPAVWSVRLLHELRQVAWTPTSPEMSQGFSELSRLAEACSGPEPPLGGLLKRQITLEGHTGRIESLALSPDNNLLVSGARDGTIRMWKLADGSPWKVYRGGSDSVDQLHISADGQLLITGCERWDASSSQDPGQWVQIWDLAQTTMLRTLKGCGPAFGLMTLPREGDETPRALASGSEDGTLRLWRLPEGRVPKRLKGHTQAVRQILVSDDLNGTDSNQRILVSGSEDQSIRLWNLPGGSEIETLKGHSGAVWSLAISSLPAKLAVGTDRHLLASGSHDHNICVWSLPDGRLQQRLKGHKHGVGHLAFSPLPLNADSGQQLLVSGSTDNILNLWRLPDGELLKSVEGRGPLLISPDGRLLVSSSNEGTLWLWQLPEGTALKTLATGESIIGSLYANAGVSCLTMSQDGRLLVAAGGNGKIWVWVSELVTLSRVPVTELALDKMDWAQEALERKGISDGERSWLEFLLALLRWRRRFDIAVEDSPDRISIGEFDIEIEG